MPTPATPTKTYRRNSKDRRKALNLAAAYVENGLRLLAELEAYGVRYTQKIRGTVHPRMPSPELEDADNELLQRIGMDEPGSISFNVALMELGRFTLLGIAVPKAKQLGRYYIGPPLSSFSPKKKSRVLALLESEAKDGGGRVRAKSMQEHETISALELLAEVYLLRDDRERGVTLLQKIIDRFPDSSRRSGFERDIEIQLGLKHDYQRGMRDGYLKGLSGCRERELAKAVNVILYFRLRQYGFPGIARTIREVEAACAKTKRTPEARRTTRHYYSQAAGLAERHGFCDDFKRYLEKAVRVGHDQKEAKAWREKSACRPGKAAR